MLFAIPANAETGSHDVQTTVNEGEFNVSFTEGGLTFGEIKKPNNYSFDYNQQILPPVVNPLSSSYNTGKTPSISWSSNEFDPNYTPPQVSTAKENYVPAMLIVENTSASHTAWKVSLSRTPFINESGEQISGESLYMGKFSDHGRFDQSIKENYQLAEYATITEEPTIVASYRGESAQGTHLISPLTFEQNDINSNSTYYTEKNIVLVISNSTKIPKSGNYSSSLVWTIEQSI